MPAPVPIFRNLWLKFFSAGLAVVIWLAVHQTIKNELSVSRLNIHSRIIAVEVVGAPGNAREYKLTPPEVLVFAVGDEAVLKRDVKATVDLSQFRGGQSLAEEVHIEAPSEITIVETKPSTVAVQHLGE